MIMDATRSVSQFVKICFVMVVTLGSEVRGRECPPGQLAHQDQGLTRCCLPVDCELHHFVSFCAQNGTSDTCLPCKSSKLFKRTSSFAVENCIAFPLDGNCEPTTGSLKASEEDVQNCNCPPEGGWYYLRPEAPVHGLMPCQPIIPRCSRGKQPNQSGECEPCPRNSVQDEDSSVKYCRPQRDCARLGLQVEIPGNSTHVAVCAKPPPPSTPTAPEVQTSKPTAKDPSTVLTTTPTSVSPGGSGGTSGDDPRVKPSRESENAESPTVVIAVATIAGALVVVIVITVIFGRKRGWFAYLCKCRQHDIERSAQPGDLPLSSRRNDNDNSSDNSCCACADSCLSTSSKPSSSKSGASNSNGVKNPLPMMEAYVNGKGGSPMHGSFSEPLYNSISHDGSKISDGNMAVYKNVPNGQVHPATMLKQEDFYGYPTKVRMPSDDEDHDCLKKGHVPVKPPPVPRKPGDSKDSSDFNETDPLLPNEDASHNITPLMVPSGRVFSGEVQLANDVGEVPRGNRPNLSMLLASVGGQPGDDPARVHNMPCLSQIMPSAPTSTGSQVSDRQLQLQQQLLQQQLQEGSTFAARVVTGVPLTTRQEPNASAVTMEELKPVMPLNPTTPGSAGSAEPGVLGLSSMTGASPQPRKPQGSPARIKPSQQEEVMISKGTRQVTHHKGAREATPQKGAREVTPQRPVQAARPTTPAGNFSQTGAAFTRESDETFRKDVIPAASPEGEDETGRKSVGGSSGLGESLDISSPLSLPSDDEARRSRAPYRRSISEASRSVSPSPVPLPRSISSPEEKHRTIAVVKPMQSDLSLNNMSSNQDLPSELMQPLDSAARHFPLRSPRVYGLRRDLSQESSDDPDATRPKTPDRLSEEEDEDVENSPEDPESDERTRAMFFGNNDSDHGGEGKSADRGSDG